MRRRSLIFFLILNVIVSLSVVALALNVFDAQRERDQQPIVVTVPIILTATPDPNATVPVIILTATPMPGTVILPTGLIEEFSAAQTRVPLPTIDEALLAQSQSLQGTATALPAGCILHEIQAGDTPFGVAERYGANGFELMAINGLDEIAASNLQIGQILIVPLEGCEAGVQALAATQTAAVATPEPTDTPTPEVTEAPTGTSTPTPTASPTTTLTPTPTPTPTTTIPPTAANAQVEIVRVLNVGDVTGESVDIRNNGPVIDLSGWTLRSSDGSVFTFPDQRRLFQGSTITVFSRVGTDTAIALFWNRQEPVWTSGATATLIDAQGRAQSVFTIP
jgi:LysM repeat protein